ncbi:MAG: NAD(+)/NADH kinase [Candidatus Caldarchaeum sp.]
MEKITVVYAGTRPSAGEAAEKLRKILPNYFNDWRVFSLKEFEENVPFLNEGVLIVLGGDGTMLRAARRITSPAVKVVGVNFGRIGYLCAVEPQELETMVSKLASGEYTVENVMRLSVFVDDEFLAEALNEVYVSATKPGAIIEYRVIQREQLASDVADGVILATSVGSTAYAFSSGGPIVDEILQSVVVVPMASMTNLRSMVLSIHSPVHISVVKGESQALVDGHTSRPVKKGVVRVEKSPRSISMLAFDERRLFSRRLRKRLYGKP